MKIIETIVWNVEIPTHERFVLCSTEDGIKILSFDRLAGYWTNSSYDKVYYEVYGWSEPKGPKVVKASPPSMEIILSA